MHSKLFRIFFVFLFSFLGIGAYAQTNTSWLENTMYQSGKINVVISVVVIMFVLITVYLISLDRKLKKLENGDKNN